MTQGIAMALSGTKALDISLEHGRTRHQDLNPMKSEAPKSARGRTHLWLILLLGALLRGCVVWYAAARLPPRWFYSRGLEMGLLADSLVHGHGLSSPFGVAATGPTAMIAPGYPLVVAGIFAIFGSYSFASLAVLLSGQLALNIITIALILDLGRRVASQRATVIAALFWTCSPAVLWMPTIFWETSFSACLLLGAVWLGWRITQTSSFLSYGLYCGIAGLINPALIPSLLVIGAVCAWRAKLQRAQSLGVLLLSFSLIYAPWPVRNAQVFHAWIPTRTTLGLELWMGNHPGSSGYLEEALFPTYNPAELGQYKVMGELRYFRTKQALATEFIRAHPARFLRLTLVRLWRFWSGSGTRRGSMFFILHAFCTTVLGGVGLWTLLRSGECRLALLLAVPVLLFPVPYYVTHAEFRYRLNIDPVMTTLAAAGLERFLRLVVRRRA